MPLLKHEVCPQCGKLAWHEFLNTGSPSESTWLCRTCGHERAVPRLSLSERYGAHHGKIQTPTTANEVRVVDLSVLGARLEFEDEMVPHLERGDTILFNAKLQPVGPLGEYRRATVRWTKGAQFGVAFASPIFASAADLTRIVKN